MMHAMNASRGTCHSRLPTGRASPAGPSHPLSADPAAAPHAEGARMASRGDADPELDNHRRFDASATTGRRAMCPSLRAAWTPPSPQPVSWQGARLLPPPRGGVRRHCSASRAPSRAPRHRWRRASPVRARRLHCCYLVRVFMYELPGDYNTFPRKAAVQRRMRSGRTHATRVVASTLYGAEVALHESPCVAAPRPRPRCRDFFYVPVYGGCFISEFNRPAAPLAVRRVPQASGDPPRPRCGGTRVLHYLSHTFPYWNASGGADHLWPFTHDEGACATRSPP